MRCIVGYEATPQGLDSLNLGIEMAKTFGYDLEIVLVLRRHDVFSAEYPPIGGVADILVSQAFKCRRVLMPAATSFPAAARPMVCCVPARS